MGVKDHLPRAAMAVESFVEHAPPASAELPAARKYLENHPPAPRGGGRRQLQPQPATATTLSGYRGMRRLSFLPLVG